VKSNEILRLITSEELLGKIIILNRKLMEHEAEMVKLKEENNKIQQLHNFDAIPNEESIMYENNSQQSYLILIDDNINTQNVNNLSVSRDSNPNNLNVPNLMKSELTETLSSNSMNVGISSIVSSNFSVSNSNNGDNDCGLDIDDAESKTMEESTVIIKVHHTPLIQKKRQRQY